MYAKGKLTSWNDDKGFGFITPFNGGKQIFIHATGFYYRNKRPEVNQIVTYSTSVDKEGRVCAIEAAFNEAPEAKRSPVKMNAALFILAVFFIFFVGFMGVISDLPIYVFCYYIVLSGVTFIVYGADKVSAQNDQHRTPEKRLHFLSLIGGWPGALLAQQKFRHKTIKVPFLLTYWVTVIVNCAGFVWLLTPRGSAMLKMIISTLSGYFL